ncbi:PIN domain nuclease [Litorilinea aerophila]|uniref:PIN domain nuclease n=1 Tax=Litorilinea aerophila TaxID=1204385 RepID=A0A540VBC5_9CHLR|nr:PIN domain-containing protein [Litorilinea aerophila]MCC9078073.1 PIN domain nuclease [Litorilinea aerophila]OUC07091.1 twitching motility protein PilT [Litorilinea aerophila]GIV77927.1 MAG: twitching motility protein PilT [Litorilinea sp.]
MRLGPVFRVIGALIYGFIGYYLGIALAGTTQLTTQSAPIIWGAMLAGAVLGYLLSPWIVIAPARAARNSLRSVPLVDLVAGTIGLAVGLFIAALLAYPLSRLPPPFGPIMPLIAVVIFGYLGAAVMVLRKDDLMALFRGTRGLPLVDSQEAAPLLLLDTSVIIDGRIADVAKTGFILGKMAVPRFVLNELQYIADSSDALRRNRGRRGLEMLDRLQQNPDVAIEFIDIDPPDAQQVDDKLISLAMELNAAIITNDYNLNRVARLQGVKILNINELANAVKSVFLPGEEMPIKIIQTGKEIGQGVGYLEDGTMVVVENGRQYLNQEILVQVTKVLQTNAGRLVFAVPEES